MRVLYYYPYREVMIKLDPRECNEISYDNNMMTVRITKDIVTKLKEELGKIDLEPWDK